MTGQTQIFIIATAIAISVLVALIYLRMQDRKAGRHLLERNTPLTEPDLDFTTLPSDTPEQSEAPAKQVISAAEPAPSTSYSKSGTGTIDLSSLSDTRSDIQAVVPQEAAQNSTPPANKPDPGSNWATALQTIREQRRKEDFESARDLCFRFLPRAQAFQQLMLTQRAIIRLRMKENRDATEDLDMLYNTAVLSTLYADSEELPETVQTALFAREALKRMEAEYSLVGYEELKYLKKTDITLLVRRWSEPMAHQHPAKVYQEKWWKLA